MGDALGVVLALVDHLVLVPGLLLQREDDASDVHVAVGGDTCSGESDLIINICINICTAGRYVTWPFNKLDPALPDPRLSDVTATDP